MRSLAPGVLILATATGMSDGDWEPPRVALTAKEFELAYPPTEPSATALGLEAMSAAIGLDLAPADVEDRVHPEPAVAKRYEAIWPAAWRVEGKPSGRWTSARDATRRFPTFTVRFN